MEQYLQAFKPCENDPLTILIAKDEDLQGNGSVITKKSKQKIVSFADICKIIFGPRILFQTLTPHEMNVHSLGERLTRFATRPFPAPTLFEFMAVTKELLGGQSPCSSDYSKRYYDNGGIAPAAFRVLQPYGDDITLSNERTHFVGDVMLLGTFVNMIKTLEKFGGKIETDLTFLEELSLARRTIENEAGIISVFHERYRPMVWTIPYFDGHSVQPSMPVLLQPGDVVWNANAEAMYILNEYTMFDPKTGSKSAMPNRTFVKTTGDNCSATTLVGYGKNMSNILRCGARALQFGSSQ
jgi:hypothetical protein